MVYKTKQISKWFPKKVSRALANMRTLLVLPKREVICSMFSSTQGILLVYDITNRWSFDGIDRWIKEIDEVRKAVDPSVVTFSTLLAVNLLAVLHCLVSIWVAIVGNGMLDWLGP